jgi:replicative DNA helicase
VIFLYRPEYYGILQDEEGRSTQGITEVIIGKQRNGPIGTVRLRFISEYMRFLSLEGGAPLSNGIKFSSRANDLPPPDEEEPPF